MNRYHLTPEREAILRREWSSATMSLTELCRALDCTEMTARREAERLRLGNRPGSQSHWPDERIERLKKLRAEGKSAAEIAHILGGGLSRSAIVGKLYRLGIPAPPETAKFNQKRNSPKGAPKVNPALRAPPVKRAPYQNAGLNFKTKAPKSACKDRPIDTIGTSAVIRSAEPPLQIPSRAWAPLPGSAPVLREHAHRTACKWPITVGVDELSHCCGRRAGAGPYCDTHAALAQPHTGAKENLDRKLGIPKARAA